MRRKIIGLVGLTGSGKTTFAEYLATKDFSSVTLSSYIRKEAIRRGHTVINKPLLQEIGNDMRKHHGGDVLVRHAYEDVCDKQHTKIVIDGIRNMQEVGFLKKQTGFVLVAIVSDPHMRYTRIIQQRGKNMIGDYDHFSEIERREIMLGNKANGLRVAECMKAADYTIQNNTTMDHLYKEADMLLQQP